jgi:hypothetical protein
MIGVKGHDFALMRLYWSGELLRFMIGVVVACCFIGVSVRNDEHLLNNIHEHD